MTSEPLWLFDIPKPARALLVVAHPDDETIFAGGLVLKSPNTEWTIISCIIQSNERPDEFRCACDFLSEKSGNPIEPIVLSLGYKSELELGRELREHVRAEDYDIVFTHNYRGEYECDYDSREKHHIKVHRCVINSIAHPNTWLFISPGSWNVGQEELRNPDLRLRKILNLPPEILILKKRALACHVSQLDENLGFDPEKGVFLPQTLEKPRDLRPTLVYNFEDPGIEEFTFFNRDIYERIFRNVREPL